MSDLVKIDPKEYGLEENKAKEIAAQFRPMLDKMEELEAEYNEVLKLPVEDPETAAKAKEVRLKYVKVRTGTAEIHKSQKAFYLAGGRFVDGWKNAQLFASQGIEEKLKEIETYQERLEAERKEKLRAERWEQLSQYREEEPVGLGEMEQDVFDALLAGAKANHEAVLEAERKAEAERIEKERLDNLERERRIEIAPYLEFADGAPELRELSEKDYKGLLANLKKAKADFEAEQEKIRKENERLKKEQEEERKRQEKLEAERKAKEEAERKEREAQARKEREAHEAELRKERAERERIQAEIKAKEEAEAKAHKEAEQAKRQSELAPDKDKLKALANAFMAVEFPTVKDAKAQELLDNVAKLQTKISDYITSNLKDL